MHILAKLLSVHNWDLVNLSVGETF